MDVPPLTVASGTPKKSNNPCLMISGNEGGSSRNCKVHKLSCAIKALQCSFHAADDEQVPDSRSLREKYSTSLMNKSCANDRHQPPLHYLHSADLDRDISAFVHPGAVMLHSQNDSKLSHSQILGLIENFADFECAEALEASLARMDVEASGDNDDAEEEELDSATCALEIFEDYSQDDEFSVRREKTVNKEARAWQTIQNSHEVIEKAEALSPIPSHDPDMVLENSSDTPTTCNRSTLTPSATPRESIRVQGRENFVDQGYESPLRRILHRSLSLGDALSPGEDDSPSRLQSPETDQDHFHPPCSNDATETTPVVLLQLPHFENKSSNAVLVQETLEIAQRHHRVDNEGAPQGCNTAANDDNSFSTVSSFTVTSNGQQPKSQKEEMQPRSRNCKNAGRHTGTTTTLRPFFWKTHPGVTFKSYHFQQPKVRMRRIVPNLERVNSMDTFSTFGRNDPPESSFSVNDSTTSCSKEERMHLKGAGNSEVVGDKDEGMDDAVSQYLHPSAVRRMWIDSNKVEQRREEHLALSQSKGVDEQPLLNAVLSIANFAHRNVYAVTTGMWTHDKTQLPHAAGPSPSNCNSF
jgi:hypothetical protein